MRHFKKNIFLRVLSLQIQYNSSSLFIIFFGGGEGGGVIDLDFVSVNKNAKNRAMSIKQACSIFSAYTDS